MSGPRQRGSVGPMTGMALESVEAGLARPLAPRIGDATQRTSAKFTRRRKSSKSVGGLVAMTKAKARRVLLRLQKSPQSFSLFLAGFVSLCVLLAIMLVAIFRNSSSESASSLLDQTDLTHKTKSHADAALHKLPRPSGRAENHKTKVGDAKRNPGGAHLDPGMQILIASIQPSIDAFNLPNSYPMKEEVWSPDYGGLERVVIEDENPRRYILRDMRQHKIDFRRPDAAQDDDVDPYYFFDDDYLRGLENAYDEHGAINENKRCRKIAEHGLNFQNCNEFHQIDRIDPLSQIKYLNKGAYRQVFSVVLPYGNQSDLIAIKDIATDHDLKYDDYEFVRMDAIVAERLTASPRIYDIYGFCGLGILSEYFYHGDIEGDVCGGDDGYMALENLHDKDEVKPQNNLTGIEKLVLALEMAESLADLHGYVNGVIVHDDVQLSQYLFDQDKKRLKLNDFNRAEFRLFDEENNDYCQWTNGKGHGNWRAPEEYMDKPLTEQIDVWSLGNNMYTLLTGLSPLYEVEHSAQFTKRIINGDTAYIDPRYKQRSPSEAELVELIPKCFAYKPEDRVTIFEIVDLLRDAVKRNLSDGMPREKVLQGVKTRQ